MDSADRRLIDRVAVRLLPLLAVCYFVAYLDRVNVSFAALTMNRDLGITSSQYGLAAGVFFLTYFAFEIPSNLILTRVGARRWIARIMVTWGLLSAGMALVTGPRSFVVLRLLLGAAEAGFFPGVIYYLTLWFPAAARARIIGGFMAAIPLSTLIGAPLSTALLTLDGRAGLHGWQWLFIIEALPAILLAGVVYRVLPDGPDDAAWLPPAERDALRTLLSRDAASGAGGTVTTLRAVFADPRVLALCAIYFGTAGLIYGVGFFLPLLLANQGLAPLTIGWMATIPYGAGVLGAVFWSRRSDRHRERRWHTIIPLLVAVTGLLLAARATSVATAVLSLTLVGWGTFATPPVFWTLPTALLTGTAAAGGIAMINAIGNLAGFLGPYAMGALRERTGGYAAGLLVLASLAAMSAVLAGITVPRSSAARGHAAA
ncbi:MAG: MFS transporter [Gemmatimonadaceae bacterium]|jgi:MFS family permease|nr:MFS transporter [Gemmatimonadaceae bacterium]